MTKKQYEKYAKVGMQIWIAEEGEGYDAEVFKAVITDKKSTVGVEGYLTVEYLRNSQIVKRSYLYQDVHFAKSHACETLIENCENKIEMIQERVRELRDSANL